MKHKWHDEIVAWANGATIQFFDKQYSDEWEDCADNDPAWSCDGEVEYRIKPKQDEISHVWVYVNAVGRIEFKLGKSKCDTWTLIGKIPLELDK